MEKFNLKELNEAEGKEQYQAGTWNRFATLENLDDHVDLNRASEIIRENIKTSAKDSLGYYELKTLSPRFDEGSSEILDQRKRPNCSGYKIQAK
jgi:hypothetical protein